LWKIDSHVKWWFVTPQEIAIAAMVHTGPLHVPGFCYAFVLFSTGKTAGNPGNSRQRKLREVNPVANHYFTLILNPHFKQAIKNICRWLFTYLVHWGILN